MSHDTNDPSAASEPLDWTKVRALFAPDGSLRDLYVFGTTVADWDRLLQALRRSEFAVEFRQGDAASALPDTLAGHFGADAERPALLLSVRVEGASLVAHMFRSDEIEFDLEPGEISSAAHYEALVRFMNFAADTLQKPMVMTPENVAQEPLLVAHPQRRGAFAA